MVLRRNYKSRTGLVGIVTNFSTARLFGRRRDLTSSVRARDVHELRKRAHHRNVLPPHEAKREPHALPNRPPPTMQARTASWVCNSCRQTSRLSLRLARRRTYATVGTKPEVYDVVCVGGGPAGLSLLNALRRTSMLSAASTIGHSNR